MRSNAYAVRLAAAASAALLAGAAKPSPMTALGAPPPGFTQATVTANGTNLHYVRGGQGPVVILLHGFPEDWVEYRAIMPRLAKRFTVVAIDLPGVGKSGPAAHGYEAAAIARDIHGLADALGFRRPYIVGHDLGGITAYAYVRQFERDLRGAMILDVPVPGVAGWDEAVGGLWHIGLIQAPKGLAETLVVGRQAAFLGWSLDIGQFTPEQRAYYARAYGAPQIHAAFEIYRGFPKDGEFNATRSAPNSAPLIVATGEKSFFNSLLPTFVEGYRAKGMVQVEGVRIPGASHYVVTDNPDAVAALIERYAATR